MTYSASFPIPEKMMDTINRCTLGLGGVGWIGGAFGPGSDLLIIAPTWAAMTVTLASQAGLRMDTKTAKKLAMAVATGAGSFALGTKVGATVLGWLLAIPSAGLSVGASCAANAALNAKFTHAYGKAAALFFLQSDDIGNTDLAITVLIALVGLQFGFPSGAADVVA